MCDLPLPNLPCDKEKDFFREMFNSPKYEPKPVITITDNFSKNLPPLPKVPTIINPARRVIMFGTGSSINWNDEYPIDWSTLSEASDAMGIYPSNLGNEYLPFNIDYSKRYLEYCRQHNITPKI